MFGIYIFVTSEDSYDNNDNLPSQSSLFRSSVVRIHA